MKAYYITKLNLIRIFDYSEDTFKALVDITDSPVQLNKVLGCIELPASEFKVALTAVPNIEMSEAFEMYIGNIKNQGVAGKLEDSYWQSLTDKLTLRPFQLEYLNWLESRRLLAYPPIGTQTGTICQLDQGLGKTITGLITDAHFRQRGFVKKSFVICRNNNKESTWVKHIEEFTNLSYVVIEGNRTQRLKKFAELKKADIGIIHYEAARLHEPELMELGRIHAIIDEAQRIANHESKQSKVINAMTKLAFWTSLLSGGVAQNRIETQLWHPLHICDRTVWPTWINWKKEWCLLDELFVPLRVRGRLIFNPKTKEPVRRKIYVISGVRNRKKLSQAISPYIFQKSKQEVSEQLPPKIYQVIETGLRSEQVKLYKQVRDDITNQVRGVTIPTAMHKTLRLIQVCATLACFDLGDISKKADEAAEIMHEIVPDDGKALVFSQFVPMCYAIQKRLRALKASSLLLVGNVGSSEEKDLIRDRFRDGDERFLVATIQLEGEGSSYPKAPYVFRLDRTHVPLKNKQAEDRAHRLTSTYDVLHIIDFVTKGSIEQEQMAILSGKLSGITNIMDLAQLYTMADIHRMLSVTPKAN